jgi:polyisoprenoid-binding protein YceI
MSAGIVEDSAISTILQAKVQARGQLTLKGLSNPVTILQTNSRAGDDQAN